MDKSCDLYKNLIKLCREKHIPFGFSADVVSGSKMEFLKSIELYKKLKQIV